MNHDELRAIENVTMWINMPKQYMRVEVPRHEYERVLGARVSGQVVKVLYNLPDGREVSGTSEAIMIVQ